MATYYNENDPFASAWLRELIHAGLIADGVVDDRSVKDVRSDDLKGFTQCHFFAGIGGWSYALRLAGWPDDRPVWTGSCPCQPFSLAGSQRGFEDPRHLWPIYKELIRECRPSVVFGEQVASATAWLHLVRSDLEAMGYSVGAIPMEAASAGADHYRDRYWFVAEHDIQQPCEELQRSGEQCGTSGIEENNHSSMADRDFPRLQRRKRGILQECSSEQPSGKGNPFGFVSHDPREREHGVEGSSQSSGWKSGQESCIGNVVYPAGNGWGEGWTEDEFRHRGLTATVASINGVQFIECSDGKWRRLPPPRVRWLGNGIPSRVAKLRGFGNAIVPQVAQAFVSAYMSIRE